MLFLWCLRLLSTNKCLLTYLYTYLLRPKIAILHTVLVCLYCMLMHSDYMLCNVSLSCALYIAFNASFFFKFKVTHYKNKANVQLRLSTKYSCFKGFAFLRSFFCNSYCFVFYNFVISANFVFLGFPDFVLRVYHCEGGQLDRPFWQPPTCGFSIISLCLL